MAVEKSDTISAEYLVEKLFTTRMSTNDLIVYFKAMHYSQDDFHIHNNLLSEYVYHHYDDVNISPAQESNVFWQENIHNLKQYLDKLLNAAEYSKRNHTVEKNKETVEKLTQNRESVEELAPKMEEHIKLALLQYETFFNEIKSVKRKADNLTRELKDKEVKLEKATKRLNNSTANFISILGIYSALIFGVFGGFDAFKSIFSNMRKTPISTVLIDGSVLMIGLITLVFILLQSIGILSGKSYLACEHDNTSQCDCSFSKRYPIFSLTLKIFLSVLIFGSIVHIANKTNFLYQNTWRIGLATIGILLLLYLGFNIIKTTKYISK
ncbi:hypothetical protein H5S40_11010 [Limosilactobacillus sp. RRLNB_1_1]|uniref:Uncharacterized protein n=1 Tax=Limosilactobacillus albertensis TaxID=2759752 RepID=A0A7W3Y927_9LACO|nr:hypothetical protein [Limosilactobacillus albertensis]MBB1070675.1 hypothetical protein [Limosilactobacillus albertensis]MCD7117422.1 hypothetical protein [Limosilactobacillus albertensis]MCD7129189.1 hypothetical protein [Limosilactobacillus albertensis]